MSGVFSYRATRACAVLLLLSLLAQFLGEGVAPPDGQSMGLKMGILLLAMFKVRIIAFHLMAAVDGPAQLRRLLDVVLAGITLVLCGLTLPI